MVTEKEIEMGKKKSAIAFEEQILTFLKNLEFEDCYGARDNFMIGGHQIDVCGGWENTLLVIECKTAREAKKKNLKSFIYEFKGKIKEICEGFQSIPKYKKYEDFRFLLVINDKIKLRPEDKEYANGSPSVYILNSDALQYYNDLYSYLKPYAKYDLLGELHIKPAQQNPISVPAFMVNLGKIKSYTFVMNPYDLLEIAYVARRERGTERYYQRIVDKERIKKIAHKEMYEKTLKRLEKEGISDTSKLHLQIGLGDCIWIMRENKKVFYPKFIGGEHEFCFNNESLLEAAFSNITSYRPSEAHYTGKEQKYGDEDVFKIYLKKLKNCLDLALKN